MSGRRRRRQDAEDEDEEEILQFGERRSLREVSWEYRDSSSLSSIERMEQAMHWLGDKWTCHYFIYEHIYILFYGRSERSDHHGMSKKTLR